MSFEVFKLSNFKNDSVTMTELNKLLENQEHKCYICSDSINLKNEDIIKTPCNHIFHYECLYYSFCQNSKNPHKRYKLREIRQCPYCRHFVQALLPRFKPDLYPYCCKVTCITTTCSAVLKSGRRKGKMCGCSCKPNSIYCGRHRNYQEITEKEDEYYLITS